MPPEPVYAPLVRYVRTAIRQTASGALARQDRSLERMVGAAFRYPVGLRPLDAAGMEIACLLGESLPSHRERIGRLLAAARMRGAAPLAVIGDSHSTHLVRRGWKDGRWLLPLHCLCSGASARGLSNPDGVAGAGSTVRAFVDALASTPMPVVFKFGQVDLEFVSTFKRLQAGGGSFDRATFEAFVQETVSRYVAFLAEATPAALRPMARVAGIFPPALSDAAWREGYVNGHIAALHGPVDTGILSQELSRLEIPPLAERTRLHASFNALLFDKAQAAGFAVFDTFEPLLGADGTVAPRFLGRTRHHDHHLGYAASRPPLVEAAWDVAAPPLS